MKKKTVMLVDDNDIDNFLHRRIVESTHMADHIIIKNSGKSALEYFKENFHEMDKLPDLLFLDIDMPVVDGLAFLFEFDEYPESVKEKCHIFILSSSASAYDRERLINNNNVEDYLVKPLTVEALAAIEERFFRNCPGTAH